MNVVIVGPFGSGTLADEAVLAGLLRHLAAPASRWMETPRPEAKETPRHETVVLSANPERTELLHGVTAIEAGTPAQFLSNRELWKALQKGHLLIIAGAGTISEYGAFPARSWLSLLEHAQTAGVKTAVVGVGAQSVEDPRERARLRRLLHQCTDAIVTRDLESKAALFSYGLSANRASATGDPTLALTPATPPTPDASRFGVILTESIPSRPGFGADPQPASRRLIAAAQDLLKDLLADGHASVTLFHDDTHGAREFVAAITEELDTERLTTQPADKPPAELQQHLGACGAVFSFSLHGLMLAAAAGTPVAGVADEPGTKAFLTSLGLQQHALLLSDGAFDPSAAAASLRALAAGGAGLRADLQRKLVVLRRKEVQTARMLELVVPRRVVRARHEEGADAFEDEGDEEDRPRRPARRAVKRRGR